MSWYNFDCKAEFVISLVQHTRPEIVNIKEETETKKQMYSKSGRVRDVIQTGFLQSSSLSHVVESVGLELL